MKESRRNFIRTVSCSTFGMLNFPVLLGANNMIIENIQKKDSKEETLFRLFQNPPMTSRPFVRWWWNGDRIEKNEIVRQLDILEDAGIGGVEINPIMFPGYDDMGIKALQWLSKEWVEMVYFAAEEVHKRGMICDIIVGSGWPFGGEFLTKEEQTQYLSVNVDHYKLVGPGKKRFSKQELLGRIDKPVMESIELYSVRMVPSYMDKFDEGIELIDKFEGDFLNVEVPYYINQQIYVTIKYTGTQSVTLGAPGASGPVLNHYNKDAVTKYLNKMSDAFNAFGDGMGTSFRSLFCDSLELHGKNWCDDMLEEFEKRRGYSLSPFVPFILTGHNQGAKIEGQALDEINRVRYDFETTKQELFKERFISTYNDWCHTNGVKSRIQAYGTSYHILEASMEIDIPECETWLGNHNGLKDHFGFTSVNKFVASAAKLAGKKLVSCEELTNISEVFFASLESLKLIGDQSNLSGVNHSVFHGYNYSPESAPFPGWVRWGSYFNERNTWWPFFRLFTDYKARLSSVFQNAEAKADIAVMHPLADKWSKYGQQFQPAFGWGERYPWYEYDLWNAIHQNGNTCDYISEKIIVDAEKSNGFLIYNKCSYSTIILMEVESIAPKTAEALAIFSKRGGKIVFIKTAPHKCPGLNNYKEKDLIVSETIKRIRAEYPEKCKVVPAPEKNLLEWFKGIQNEFNINATVKISEPDGYVSQVRFAHEDRDIFFFINSDRKQKRSFKAEFNTGSKIPWIWDPETGERFLYPYEYSRNELSIELAPAESKLIVFDSDVKGVNFKSEKIDPFTAFEINGPWEIEFKHTNGSTVKKLNTEIFDLKNDPELKAFAGTIIYRKTIDIKDGTNFSIVNLGKVHGITKLSVNKKLIGTKWYGDHIYMCGDLLKSKQVTIEIAITTIIGNYCKSLTDNKTCQEWTRNQAYESMGLLGPVKLFQIL